MVELLFYVYTSICLLLCFLREIIPICQQPVRGEKTWLSVSFRSINLVCVLTCDKSSSLKNFMFVRASVSSLTWEGK